MTAETDAVTPEELALLWGTFILGRWCEVMASDVEPPDDWQEQAAAEAVALFRPALDALLGRERAEALDVAATYLDRVVDYWEGRPLTHHGVHIHADLCEVLAAIRSDANHNDPRTRPGSTEGVTFREVSDVE
jgi:hypothetical protein